MSRIGKNPVPVPAGVEVSVSGQEVKTKGKLELQFVANSAVEIKFENGEVSVSHATKAECTRPVGHGTGADRQHGDRCFEGFSELELVGVGYRAALKGKDLQLQFASRTTCCTRSPMA